MKQKTWLFKSFEAGTSDFDIHFVGCLTVEKGKADNIVSETENVCKRIGLDMLKVIAMASVGANVMIGEKGGVGVKLS